MMTGAFLAVCVLLGVVQRIQGDKIAKVEDRQDALEECQHDQGHSIDELKRTSDELVQSAKIASQVKKLKDLNPEIFDETKQ